ncbi:MAG: winged helix-turn-helix domain-containing protein [Pseudoxanthomonas sp.]
MAISLVRSPAIPARPDSFRRPRRVLRNPAGNAQVDWARLGECLGRSRPSGAYAWIAPGFRPQTMPQPEPPNRLAFDDVVIDLAGRRLWRGGLEQPLEPKAFGVLALLAGSPGRAFARDEILDAVWGHRHVTPGVLNRVMTLLRHALGEEAHAARYLHTVHGVGYRFDLPGPAPPAPEPETESIRAQLPMHRADGGQRPFPRWVLGLLLLLALLALAGWKWWPRASTASPPAPVAAAPATERSIAVLPLANTSNDKEQQFFSDGLSDNLIDVLSKLEGLRVIGRNSAFQFRDSKDDSATIGRKLGVAYLLNGSVQRAGDMVRINTTLTKAADGSTLWAEHYDRPYKDLFALQDDIASAVAGALQAKLLPANAASKQDDRPPSGNIDAYIAYLQGLKYWHDQDFPRAAEYMTQAVQLDPSYAMAWAHLSGSWSTVAMFWNQPPAVAHEQVRKSRLAADKALQLSPGLGPAHAARAYLQFYSFDHRSASIECRRAVRLAPDDGTVLNGCGHTLAGIGKLGEAIRLRERLLSIDPLYIVNDFKYAELLMAVGRLDEAEKHVETAMELSKRTQSQPYYRLRLALLRGDAKAALEAARQANPDMRDLDLAFAAQIGPDRAAADAALAKLLRDDKDGDKRRPYDLASLYALRGDVDGTVEWLERARDRDILFMLADPLILRFRNDLRLAAFCKKTGLPPPSESEALSIDQIRAKLVAER